MALADIRRRVDLAVARRDVLAAKAGGLRSEMADLQKLHLDHCEALPLVLKIGQLYRKVSLATVNSLVTAALRAVFEHPYVFELRQSEKRGQIELTPVVIDGALELDPTTSMGGGVVDVLSIALRVALRSRMRKPSSAVMVYDEPARQVNSERSLKNLALLFNQLAATGLQFLIVTNRPHLAGAAAGVYTVAKRRGVSEVAKREGA